MAAAAGKMIPVDEALEIVLAVARRLHPVTVPLHEASGRILAEDIRAPDPLPPYPASVKDGYAVVAADGPGEYPVITESRAGNDGLGVCVTPGTVAYVTTGGPIPDGADAVIQVEDTERILSEPKRVKVLIQASHGADIRPVGCDIQKDDVVLKSGDRIGPPEIGLLATVGVTMVKVYPIPTIAVLSTGDELVEPTKTNLGRGQIRDSNRAMLLAAATGQNCKIMNLGIAQDDEAGLARVLDDAILCGADIILTSGGVSMGDRDFVKPLLEQKGKVYFSKVNMKPGKPLTFAEINPKRTPELGTNQVLAFGLPGNPVSCLVCFHLFVMPAIRQLSGWTDSHPLRVLARLEDSIRTDRIRLEFHRAIVKWKEDDGSGSPGFVAESTGQQMSSRLTSMRGANALLELPPTGNVIVAGTRVSAIIISELIGAPPSIMSSSKDAIPSKQSTSREAVVREPKMPNVKVAILTVSDTVASGAGPDRSSQDEVAEEEEEDEEEEEAPTKKRTKRRAWSEVEDKLLTSAWLNTSKDAIQGNKQASDTFDTFWERVTKYYDQRRGALAARTSVQCKTHFQKMSKSVSKFASVYNATLMARKSGQSEDDVILQARALFTQDQGTNAKFKLDHVWRMLRNEQKWRTYVRTSYEGGTHLKRSRVSEDGAYTLSSNLETPTSEDKVDCSPIQPPALKTSKRVEASSRGKGAAEPSVASGEATTRNELLSKLISLKEFEMQQKAIEMEMRRKVEERKSVDSQRRKIEVETKAAHHQKKWDLLIGLQSRSVALSHAEEVTKEKLLQELSSLQ